MNRYTVEEPSGEAASDVSAWKKMIETAHMQLEYQRDKWVKRTRETVGWRT